MHFVWVLGFAFHLFFFFFFFFFLFVFFVCFFVVFFVFVFFFNKNYPERIDKRLKKISMGVGCVNSVQSKFQSFCGLPKRTTANWGQLIA